MKASISKGSKFSGLCRYVFDLEAGSKGNKKPEVVGGNMSGDTYEAMMRQFAVVKRIRPDIQKPVWHCSLSFPPGESPDKFMLGDIADEFMKKMGFSDVSLFTVIRHSDKPHDHIHIVASRIGLDGKVWKAGRDVFKALRATEELENEFNLTRTKGFDINAERKNPKFSERQMALRMGEVPPKVWLQERIDEVVTMEPTAVEFCEYLEANGVEVRANLASTGLLNGFSFSVDGIAFKGSSLGKVYAWGGLQARGVTYEHGRDFEGMKVYAAGTGKNNDQVKPQELGKVLSPVDIGLDAADKSPKDRLKKQIQEAATGRPTAVEFCERLQAVGVEVKVNLARTGRLNGFTFTIDGVMFKGSSLGKAYSWGGLQKQGVTYESKRDMAGLEKFKAAAVESAVDRAGNDIEGAQGDVNVSETAVERAATVIEGAQGDVSAFTGGGGFRSGEEYGGAQRAEQGSGGTQPDSSGVDREHERGKEGVGIQHSTKEGLREGDDGSDRNYGDVGFQGEQGHRLPSSSSETGGSKALAKGNRVSRNGAAVGGGGSDSADMAWRKVIGDITEFWELKSLREKRRLEEERWRQQWLAEEAEKARKAVEKARQEEAERLKFEEKGVTTSVAFFTQKHEELNIPAWCGERFNLWCSPKTARVYLFHRERKVDAPVAMDNDKVYALRKDDESILLALKVARDRWPGQKLEISGSDVFKARAKALAKEHKLGIDFVPEPEKAPEPPRPRSMGMGR